MSDLPCLQRLPRVQEVNGKVRVNKMALLSRALRPHPPGQSTGDNPSLESLWGSSRTHSLLQPLFSLVLPLWKWASHSWEGPAEVLRR